MPRPKKNLEPKSGPSVPAKNENKMTECVKCVQKKGLTANNDNKVTSNVLRLAADSDCHPVLTGGHDVEVKSLWQRKNSMVFEVMKTIQILVCLAYCLFFLLATISKKEWLKAYHDNIRINVYGLTIQWYESALYFFISGVGLVGAVGEVLCCCIFYSITHTIAFPYCIVPWFVTIGIYRGWGWTQMYTKVCTNFKKLIHEL